MAAQHDFDILNTSLCDTEVPTKAGQVHYAQQLRRCWAKAQTEFYDPQCPWRRRVADLGGQSSHAAQEQRIADFNARQLDLFRPQLSWDDEF